jgi:hypothetical protein
MKVGYLSYVFTLGETTYPWRWYITIPVIIAFLLIFLNALKRARAPGEQHLRLLLFILIAALVILIPLSEIHRNFSSRTFQLPSKIVFLLPIFLLMIVVVWYHLEKRALKVFLAVLIVVGNAYGLTNYFTGKQFLNPKFLAPWRQILMDIEAIAEPQDLVITDEEGLPWEMRLQESPIEVFGLVNSMEKVSQTLQERGSFHVFLLVRYRGDEQITLETLQVRDQLARVYPIVNILEYVPIPPETIPFWKRVLGREPPEHLIQVFLFNVTNQSEEPLLQ